MKTEKTELLKKYQWQFLIAFEMILFGIAIVVCVKKYHADEVQIEFGAEQLQVLQGNADQGYYIDGGMEDYENIRIGKEDLLFPKGSYEVDAVYDSNAKIHMQVTDQYNRQLSGDVVSRAEAGKKFEIFVEDSWVPISVNLYMAGGCKPEQYLLVTSIKFTSTFTWYKKHIFELLFVIILADIGLWLYGRRDRIPFLKQEREVLVSLGIIAFVSSIPLMVDYLMIEQHDILFHLFRIEGIANGLSAGEFPVRIQSQWLNGHGYPVSVMYGDAFLYIPALFRIMGFDAQISYKAFVVFVNIATAGSSFFCFSKIGKDKRIGVIASAVYTLNLFRLTEIYTRAAVGEYTAMVFYPIVLYGLWYIFTKQQEEIRESGIWLVLGFGYLGILLSHLISCETIGLFTVLVCLLQIKKVVQKERFFALFKAFLFLIAGGLWFVVPMLDYMGLGLRAAKAGGGQIQETGLFWAQFFINRYHVGGSVQNTASGIKGEMPSTLGLIFLVILFAAIFLISCRNKAFQEKKQFKLCFILTGIFMWLCTKDFPYDWIAKQAKIGRLLVRSLQFPMRFLAILSLLCTWMLVLVLMQNKTDVLKKGLFEVFVAVILLSESVTFMSEVLNSFEAEVIKDGRVISSFTVEGGEYLYAGADTNDYVDEITEIGDGVAIESAEKGSLRLELRVTNSSSEEQTLELPLINYKGYQAVDTDTGKRLYLSDGSSHRINLHLPSEYSGNILVKFVAPWYWRAAEIISFLFYGMAVVMAMRYGRYNISRKIKNL